MSSDVLCYFVGNKPLTRGAEKNYQWVQLILYHH
jgi:hypothetical protein